MKMKRLVIGVMAMALVGCTVTKVSKSKDGWTAYNNSFLWSRQNVAMAVQTNGVISFTEDSSTPDQKTLAAVLNLAMSLAGKL